MLVVILANLFLFYVGVPIIMVVVAIVRVLMGRRIKLIFRCWMKRKFYLANFAKVTKLMKYVSIRRLFQQVPKLSTLHLPIIKI